MFAKLFVLQMSICAKQRKLMPVLWNKLFSAKLIRKTLEKQAILTPHKTHEHFVSGSEITEITTVMI